MPDLSPALPPGPPAPPTIAPAPAPGAARMAQLFRHHDGDIAALQLMTLLRAYRNAMQAADPATGSAVQGADA